jgi:hypothetical protein
MVRCPRDTATRSRYAIDGVEPAAPAIACRAAIAARARSSEVASRASSNGLQQIVHRAGLEGLDRVAGVSGHEHDEGLRRHMEPLRQLEAAEARHLDIEECHVRLHGADGAQRGLRVLLFGHDLHVGVVGKQRPQATSRQRLIIRDHDPQHPRPPGTR